jgi:hypothetical protein
MQQTAQVFYLLLQTCHQIQLCMCKESRVFCNKLHYLTRNCLCHFLKIYSINEWCWMQNPNSLPYCLHPARYCTMSLFIRIYIFLLTKHCCFGLLQMSLKCSWFSLWPQKLPGIDLKININILSQNSFLFTNTISDVERVIFRLVCKIAKSNYQLHPIRPRGTAQLPLDRFSWNLIFEYLKKNCHEYSCFIQIRQEYQVLYKKSTRLFHHISLSSS